MLAFLSASDNRHTTQNDIEKVSLMSFLTARPIDLLRDMPQFVIIEPKHSALGKTKLRTGIELALIY